MVNLHTGDALHRLVHTSRSIWLHVPNRIRDPFGRPDEISRLVDQLVILGELDSQLDSGFGHLEQNVFQARGPSENLAMEIHKRWGFDW